MKAGRPRDELNDMQLAQLAEKLATRKNIKRPPFSMVAVKAKQVTSAVNARVGAKRIAMWGFMSAKAQLCMSHCLFW